ncbi:MAG: serine/threonine protein kinase [Deltaproteobacteria bacterium]|nr:serine/threonine protein kinase [Deltaproteobacteria bacterium]
MERSKPQTVNLTPPALRAPGLCPKCQTPFGGRILCPNDGALSGLPAVIGERYQLQRLLGAGGMGFVYAATHTMLGKGVAVKVLRAELSADADQVQRFLREARLSSQLRHENIVDVTDFGRDPQGHLYIAMELLTGTTLAEILAQGQLGMRRGLAILKQLCRALECAHSAGIVHRDLSPRNVFITQSSGRSDIVKLLDFGISRLADGGDRVTSTGVPVGTTPYMPPEQLRGDNGQDQRVDIYALGVIAYQLLSGELPFRGDSAAQLIAEKLAYGPIDLRETDLARHAPAVAQLIAECLAQDPRRRPATVGEVEQRLLSSGGVVVEQSEDLVGMRAGSYRLVQLLGSGGLGSVWLGEHPVIGSKVAIKILHPEMCESAEAVRRFVIEAQAVNRVDSPHIVKTFDFGKLPDGRDYAVMELLEGETVGQRLERAGAFSWSQARPVLLQLAEALTAAHDAGIVHRDLKPDNIHLAQRESTTLVKVLDFGIAKLLDADVATTHQTRLGVCIGTPLYAPPEQVAGQPIGPAADIYAFGALIYEMLGGQPPFVGTIQEVLTAKMSQTPEPLASVCKAPPMLAQLVDRMLDRDPKLRPASIEVLRLLNETPTDLAQLRRTHAGWTVEPSEPQPQPLTPISVPAVPAPEPAAAVPLAQSAAAHPKMSRRLQIVIALAVGVIVASAAFVALVTLSRPAANEIEQRQALAVAPRPKTPALQPTAPAKPTPAPTPSVANPAPSAAKAAVEPSTATTPEPRTPSNTVDANPSTRSKAPSAVTHVWLRSRPAKAYVRLGRKLLGRTPLLLPFTKPMRLTLVHAGYRVKSVVVEGDTTVRLRRQVSATDSGKKRPAKLVDPFQE